MTTKLWKSTERKIAELIGGTRVPVTGRQRGDAPDIRHRWLSPEVKSYAVRPPSIHDALAQARASARNGQLPIAIFHRRGDAYRDAVVLLSLGDFLEWFGGE